MLGKRGNLNKVKSQTREKKREREVEREKNNKILNARATITVHICMVTVANVQICTLLEALMLSIFETKCIKFVSFFYYARLCIH